MSLNSTIVLIRMRKWIILAKEARHSKIVTFLSQLLSKNTQLNVIDASEDSIAQVRGFTDRYDINSLYYYKNEST